MTAVKERYIDWPSDLASAIASYGTGNWTCNKELFPSYVDALHAMKGTTLQSYPQGIPIYQGYERFFSTKFSKPMWNNCEHTKRIVRAVVHSVGGFTGTVINNWACPGTTVNSPAEERVIRHYIGYGRRLCTTNNTCPQFTTFVLPPDTIIDRWPDLGFRAEAWANFQPVFRGEVSTINFLFELKDFRDIANHLCPLIERLTRNYPKGKNVPDESVLEEAFGKLLAEPTFKPAGEWGIPGDLWRLSGRTAEAWLTYAFAVAPFLRDMADLIAMFYKTASVAYQKFVEKGESTHTVHFSRSFVHLDDLVPAYTANPASSVPYYFGNYRYTKWTANMMRTYSCAPHSQWDIEKAFWGLNLTPRALWNALPFSFLVDYVFSIDKALKLAERDKEVDARTIQYCESVLHSNTHGIHINPKLCTYYYRDDRSREVVKMKQGSEAKCVTGLQRSEYRRFMQEPYFGPVLPDFRMPGIRQMANVAALLRCVF